jgi:hypothetical protein
MIRYINASDLCKILGTDYCFYWTQRQDILRILYGIKSPDELMESITNTQKNKIIETVKKMNILPEWEIIKKHKKDLDSILYTEIQNSKNEIINGDDYNTHRDIFTNQLPTELKKVVESDFTKSKGVYDESIIIRDRNLNKSNELKYFSFTIEGQCYKIGCRFDSPLIEIKSRKNKLLGVTRYELVQVMVYMAVEKVKQWTLVEKFNDQIIDHLIEFDEVFFENVKIDLHRRWNQLIKEYSKDSL